MKNVLFTVLIVAALILSFIALDYGYLHWFKFIEPKKEDARREVFLKTRSYNEAKIQELVKYRYEYMTTKDADSKKALASVIRHTFAEYDESKLSQELQNFLKQIKYGE